MSKNTGGEGQGDFDNVQIEAEFLPGYLPLVNSSWTRPLRLLAIEIYAFQGGVGKPRMIEPGPKW